MVDLNLWGNKRDYDKLSKEDKEKYYLEYLYDHTDSKCRVEDDYLIIRLLSDESIKERTKFVAGFLLILLSLFFILFWFGSKRTAADYKTFFWASVPLTVVVLVAFLFMKINANKDLVLDKRDDSIYIQNNILKKKTYLGRLSSFLGMDYGDHYLKSTYTGSSIKLRLANSRLVKVCLYEKRMNNFVFDNFNPAFLQWFNKSKDFLRAPKDDNEYLAYIYHYSLSTAEYSEGRNTIQLFSDEFKKASLARIGSAGLAFCAIYFCLYLGGEKLNSFWKVVFSGLFVLGVIALAILTGYLLKRTKDRVYIDGKKREVRVKNVGQKEIIVPFDSIESMEKVDRQKKEKYILPSKLILKDQKGQTFPIAYYHKKLGNDFFFDFTKDYLNKKFFQLNH